MILKLFFLTLSLIIFTIYVSFILHKYGIQKSISDSYYRLKGIYQAIFTFFIWGSAVPVMIAAETPLMFFAGSLICFVGAAPAFKKTMLENTVHIVGASGGFALAFISIIHEFGFWWLALPAAILAATFKKSSPYYIWFAEIIGFITIFIAITFHLVFS